MILGMPASTYTFIHVVLSLIGIGSGLVVMFGLIAGKRLEGWTALFLGSQVATSVTGFGFPFDHLLPSHVVGVVSLVVLTIAILARYPIRMTGAWRRVYVIGAAVALYLDVFVGVVQAFLKVPALNALAPKQTEPPFVIAQAVALVLCGLLGTLAAIRFRPRAVR
jgi:hypothetical protein